MTTWRGNPWAILMALCLGFFMTLLDLTIVNIAIPSMIDHLRASLDEILWVINAYALALAVLLITAGRLGDLYGRRRMFVIGVVVFTVASVLCGVSQGPELLIAARVLQGVGAAILMPQTMAIIIGVFPPERRGLAMGVWSAVAGVATLAGPTLGGFLVTAFDWRWIFFVNVPIGVIVLFLAMTAIPPTRITRRHRLDVPGVLISTAALFCLAFALTEGERFHWNRIIVALAVAGLVLLAIFLDQQRRAQGAEPLIPFALFHDRNYTLMNGVSVAISIAMIGTFLPLTLYLQSVLGMSALKAGLTLAPMSLTSMVAGPVAGRLADRVGGKYLLMSGLVMYAVGVGLIAIVARPHSDWPVFVIPLVAAGLGVGFTFAPLGTLATLSVPPEVAGAASGVLNTNRQLGSVIGGAVIGALLQNRLAAALAGEAERRAGLLPPQAREPFLDGFRQAARGGLEVGAGQTGVHPPGGLPAEAARRVAELAHEVFTQAFVTAMRPTLAVAVVVILCGAALSSAARRTVRNGVPAGR
ncbi:DHA2 family efflux MFS transporter permease subunit [Bailinhaonella thermotolerans]|uniref:DHA2 family efflux MFS transporter permease subunit n=1 Tax=Bailinhaonella thermotolerans TaxID=1070861 RepID=A0A3A4AYK4_9ACTN|nr:DHA2 family efflux MFS transporter permease subunit [Bailinhaonella thermotolerans]RJL33469.1 DHA2 family efflux MFS transporter permease subunit [Bailinhaonella thermotolerans]